MRNKNIGGLVLTGCLFIGMATGAVCGDAGTGLFFGMGIGFLGMAAVRHYLHTPAAESEQPKEQ